MIYKSTGMRDQLLVTGSFKSIFDAGFIKIYSGAVPANADATLGAAVLLCTISNNATGTGLTFNPAASGGVLTKTTGEVWSGVVGTSGTASFYRLVTPTDSGLDSTTDARLQGAVGMAGSDINLTSVSLVAAAVQPLDYYAVNMLP